MSRELKASEAMAVWRGEFVPTAKDRADLLTGMSDHRKAKGDEDGAAAIAAGESARFWSILILAVSAISGGLLAFFIVSGINKVLTQVVTELSEGADQVSSVAAEVSASSQSLAQGASKQAASLEETSASSEEINSVARRNARTPARPPVW